MDSFEGLGLAPELVEALAAEGIEQPTAFQRDAIPVIRRGNSLVAAAGPGAGTLVAYGTGLLDRLDPGGDGPSGLVIAPTTEAAGELAESLARLAQGTGHAVAALDGSWALPERADLLFTTATALEAALARSGLTLEGVRALVIDGGGAGLDPADVERLLAIVPSDAQRIVVSLPVSDELEHLAGERMPKAVHVPPRPVDATARDGPDRGVLTYAVAGPDKTGELLRLVAGALHGDARHALIYFSSEDRAADVGDYLTLRGFVAGAPGDPSVPVWLAVDPLAGRGAALAEEAGTVLALSFDVPGDPDALDRRHGGGLGGTILALPREVAHLRQSAQVAGYRLKPSTTDSGALEGALEALRARVAAAAEEHDLGPYFLVLEPLLERYSAAELAAASLALLQRGTANAPAEPAADTKAPQSLVRLFVSLGSRDGVRPGDLLGTLAGESGVDGGRFGRIEIRESFSLVEVEESAAETVIKAVNGVTIRGRSTRVDYDRGTRPGRKSPQARGRKGSRGS